MQFLDAVAKGFGGVYTTEEILEKLNGLPTGAVIATATLKGCHMIDRIREMGCAPQETGCWNCDRPGDWIDPTELEIMFGDWTPGRWAWEMENVKLLPDPVPMRGSQGLWDWRAER